MFFDHQRKNLNWTQIHNYRNFYWVYSFKVIIRHNLLIDTTAYRTQNHGLCLVIAKFRLLFTGPKLLIRHKKSGNNWLIETNGWFSSLVFMRILRLFLRNRRKITKRKETNLTNMTCALPMIRIYLLHVRLPTLLILDL